MDFKLSDQQTAFRDLMRDFARKSISPVAREWELAGRYPEQIVDEMRAMGLFGMLVPEAFGGIAIDAVSYSIVFEEISRACALWNAGAARQVAAGSRQWQEAVRHRSY
jgi:alkylation response protein AidB-like acyl-CoA dehydrogenase